MEAGDSRRRLELVSPRVWDISTEVTWFRVMLSSAALRKKGHTQSHKSRRTRRKDKPFNVFV